MKATLEFNLPEDREDFELATRASRLQSFIFDLATWVRQKYKYEDVEAINIEDLQDKLGELYEENEVSPYD